MKELNRETAASEVIGAVLLVSLVVIGGAVVAAFVFGQPAPKEVPHLSFSAYLEQDPHDEDQCVLTLFHTGGDTLQWGEFSIIVDGQDMTSDVVEQGDPWSLDSPRTIPNVDPGTSSVVLTYRDGGGGDTVLRKVGVAYQPPGEVPPPGPWTISGYKTKIGLNGQPVSPEGVKIRLTKTEGDFDFYEDDGNGVNATTNETGFYSFTVPSDEATYRLEELELNQNRWRPEPAGGVYGTIRLYHYQTRVVRNFTNRELPPPPWTISGHKYNVTWANRTFETNGTIEDVPIRLTLESGTDPTIPPGGLSTTTDENGYYEFPVQGYWDDAIPPTLPTYRLTEEVDRAVWMPHNPVTLARDPSCGVIANVPLDATEKGATDQDFFNEMLIPNKKIWGHKYGYYDNTLWSLNNAPWPMGPVAGITIQLTLTDGRTPDMNEGETNTTTTDASGYYEFIVSGYHSLYTVRELPDSNWTPWIPANGIYTDVPPGVSRDFKNIHVRNPMGGEVIRLEKTEAAIQGGNGYLVNGTYLQVDTTKKSYVVIDGTRYSFGNNDQVRLVINGDQDRGRMTVTKGGTDLVEWSFNTTVQKKINGVWTTIASGPVSEILIENINKNGGNEDESTLAYMHAPYLSWTMLRLNGEPVITSPPDDPTPFEFRNLHIVHDNRYHEGNNIMWIWLEPGNNSLLVQGDYVYL